MNNTFLAKLNPLPPECKHGSLDHWTKHARSIKKYYKILKTSTKKVPQSRVCAKLWFQPSVAILDLTLVRTPSSSAQTIGARLSHVLRRYVTTLAMTSWEGFSLRLITSIPSSNLFAGRSGKEYIIPANSAGMLVLNFNILLVFAYRNNALLNKKFRVRLETKNISECDKNSYPRGKPGLSATVAPRLESLLATPSCSLRRTLLNILLLILLNFLLLITWQKWNQQPL